MKLTKEDIQKYGTEDEKKILLETGEMGQYDIETGGDWYEAAQTLKQAARHIGKLTKGMLEFIKIRPFDQYLGPYAQCKAFGSWARLWFSTPGDNMFYLEGPADIDMEGDVYDIARQMRQYQKREMTKLAQEHGG
jgi:hypothetical protein